MGQCKGIPMIARDIQKISRRIWYVKMQGIFNQISKAAEGGSLELLIPVSEIAEADRKELRALDFQVNLSKTALDYVITWRADGR